MPYNKTLQRVERINVEMSYDTAFQFWGLKGVIAERWAHGPHFSAWSDQGNQVTLTPSATPAEDARLIGAYGIMGSGLLAEGPHFTPVVDEIATKWFSDVHQVLAPRRVVRSGIQVFALYPIDDPVPISRKLRSRYYRNDNLENVLPQRLQGMKDRYHAAIDMLFHDGDSTTAIVVGVVGPLHMRSFFQFPNEDRDGRWWIGMKYDASLSRINPPDHIEDPIGTIRTLIDNAKADIDRTFDSVLTEILG